MLPEAGFLEAEMLRCISLFSELPLAGDCGGISGLFELMGEGGLSAIQHTELHVVAHIILPGHDLYPGVGADRVGKAVGKAHTGGSQLVEVGRLAGFTAVGGEGLVAHVISHDEDDIRAGLVHFPGYLGKR